MKKAILFCYHGSKDTRGRADTKKLTKIFKKKILKHLLNTVIYKMQSPQ